MSVDLREGQATSLVFRPPALWASPTGLVLDPLGDTLEAPTPVLSTVSTTVAASAANDESQFDVVLATGIARGDLLQVTDPSWGDAQVEVSSVDGVTVTTAEPLPGVPDTGSVVKGLDIRLPVAAITTRGLGYRAIVRQDADELVSVFHVVHHPFRNPIDARRVRRFVARFWASDPLLRDEETLENLAEAAGRRLRSRLLEHRSYPHRFWDADDLTESGVLCMMLELAEENRIPGGADPVDYRRGLILDLAKRIGGAVAGATPYDNDDDGKLSETELTGVTNGTLFR